MRVGGQFTSEASLKAINLRVNDRFFRLSDVADIHRGYPDPPQPLFRYDGRPAIGLAVAMRPGGNLLVFGRDLKAKMRTVEATLPIGVGVHLVSDQPRIVEHAVGGFTEALGEAIAIVLLVSFISLGVRAGLVVSISIPLVLAATFVVLEVMGVTLQRISLGALIIALGLLVDDAMITVEMMVARLERGDTRTQAATFAYTSTAFPMLTGTLATVAGFLPIGFNGSAAGEYTYSLFVVIAASLLVSWVVAVLFAPLVGVVILPKALKRHAGGPGRLMRAFRSFLLAAMRWRWVTVGLTLATLALAVYGMRFVQQQFFPASDRPEILVDMTLPQSSSTGETKRQMDRFEARLVGNPDVAQWSSYVGEGAIRFYLPLDQQLGNSFYGQIVIETTSLAARNKLMPILTRLGREQFVGTDVFVHSLDLGPPVGRPVQYRVSGPDVQAVRQQAVELARIVGANAHLGVPTYDWNEPGEVLRVNILQDKARQLGVTAQDIAGILNAVARGTDITQVRDSIYLVNVVGRAQERERNSIDVLGSLQVPLSNGRTVPLLAFARLEYGLEQPIVWRRDRLPTVTLRSTIVDATQPATVVAQLKPQIDAFAKALPIGFALATGGAVEESAKGQGPIALRGAGDAADDGVPADGAAAKLRQAAARDLGRAARPDRRGRRAAALGRAARLRRHPRRAGPHRHHHPQLGHPRRADRRVPGRGSGAMGRGGGGDLPPGAADPAHRRRRKPRHDPDRPRSVLGTDGLRDDRRHPGGHRAHPGVPAGALRRLLPHPAGGPPLRAKGCGTRRTSRRCACDPEATRPRSTRAPSPVTAGRRSASSRGLASGPRGSV